jgi:hypothetical protein
MPKAVDAGTLLAGHEPPTSTKIFAVSYVILCEKLRISLRVDSYGGVWVARLDGSNGSSSDNQHATTKSVYRN